MFHVKLFLGITNMDKRGKIDLGKLSLYLMISLSCKNLIQTLLLQQNL